MKIIITENQNKLRHLYRRIGEIEDVFKEYEELFTRTAKTLNKDGFIHAVGMFIGDIIAGKLEEKDVDFDYVTFRNQIKRFVETHFYEELIDFYFKHKKQLNESNNMAFLRKRETIKDLIDNGIEVIRNDTDVCDYTFSEFLTEVSWQVSDNSDELGIELTNTKIDLIHRWVRNNFSQYIKDEYLELIDSEGCNDYDEDEIDDDYLSGFLHNVDNNQ
jgi:hypothetical protein